MAFFQRQWLFSPAGRFGLTRRQRWNCSEIFNGNSSWLMLVVLWMVRCISLCTCNLFDFVSVFFLCCQMWWWSYSDKNRVKHVLLCYIYHLSAARRGDVLRLVSAPNFARFKSLDGFQRWSTDKNSASTKGDLGTTSADIPLVCRFEATESKTCSQKRSCLQTWGMNKESSKPPPKENNKKHTLPILGSSLRWCLLPKDGTTSGDSRVLSMDPSSQTCLNMSTWSVEATGSGVDTGIAYLYFSHTHTYIGI